MKASITAADSGCCDVVQQSHPSGAEMETRQLDAKQQCCSQNSIVCKCAELSCTPQVGAEEEAEATAAAPQQAPPGSRLAPAMTLSTLLIATLLCWLFLV